MRPLSLTAPRGVGFAAYLHNLFPYLRVKKVYVIYFYIYGLVAEKVMQVCEGYRKAYSAKGLRGAYLGDKGYAKVMQR